MLLNFHFHLFYLSSCLGENFICHTLQFKFYLLLKSGETEVGLDLFKFNYQIFFSTSK